MKKTHLFTILVFALFFLTACAPRFPQVDAYYISPFELTDREKLLNKSLALSPDGNTILVGSDDIVRLESGEQEDLNLYGRIESDSHDIFTDFGFWSFDGRYLGMQAQHYVGRDPVGYVTYIFDLLDNTFRRFDTWSNSFSPFNSYQILTSEGVYNLNDGTTIPFSPNYDFRQDKEFRSTKYGVLQSKNLGVPVAEINTLPYTLPSNAPDKIDTELAIETYFYANPDSRNYSILTGIKFNAQSNGRVRVLLDPTGEYILIVEWQCNDDGIPCGMHPLNADKVYDTVLTLVRWRTQERQELNGSTIFISRKDALPIVLKVK